MRRGVTAGEARAIRDAEAWRHAGLAATLRRRIAAGEIAVGDRLPTERAIAEAEQVSRGTVREALRLLELDGMIRRRQGSGTTVISKAPRSYMQPLESLEALLSYPEHTRITLAGSEMIIAGPEHETLCGMPAGQEWLRLDLRRYAGDADGPVSHTYAYCPPEFVTDPEEVDAFASPVFRLVERKLGHRAARVGLRIDAIATPAELAEALGVPCGAPAIRILRCYHDAADQVFQVSNTTHPSGRFAFTASLQL